jgi:methylase of polypeptide subunit release factors
MDKYSFAGGNSASGIDIPSLGVDIKVTSIKQPQSSCPFKSARQKIYGLGYHLIVFVYEKTDDAKKQTGCLNMQHTIFVEKERTGDYQMTRGIREIVERDGNVEDLIAFMRDRNLPVEEIEASCRANPQGKTGARLLDDIERASVAASIWPGHTASRDCLGDTADLMPVKQRKSRAVTEFGDFQTPPALALAATKLLRRLGIRPRSILEPTCGRGAFVAAAATVFPEAESIFGIDINQDHLGAAVIAAYRPDRRVELRQGDFFKHDWRGVVTAAEGPWLILGNPPWVTSANLGAIESNNLPEKSNFQGRKGIEAITGKSNFDISEWMLLRYLDWLENGEGTIAVLCKTAVARKILLHIWKNKEPLRSARIYKIDALGHFGAAVDACFFILEIHPKAHSLSCEIFDTLEAETPLRTIGFLDGHIISNIGTFNQHRSLLGPGAGYVWRSGVKHDCSKVMELTPTPQGYENGLGETVALEDAVLFPMLKSSTSATGAFTAEASCWSLSSE